MTIINPTPFVRNVNPARTDGMSQNEQLVRLSQLAEDVSRRFCHAENDTSALSYVFHAEDFDAAIHGDAAARLVARVLAFITSELAEGDLPDSCGVDRESKQYRKGYEAALDQVGSELLEAISVAH